MDAVCFDMDGVLVDSEDYWIAFQRESLLPEAVPGESVDTDLITGIAYVEQYDILAEEHDLALDRETWARRYEEHAGTVYGEQAELTPGVREILETLRARSVPTALVTSAPASWYETVLDRWDLAQYFDATVSAEDLDGAGKPEPQIYHYAAEQLGVAPADLLVIEDSEHGIAAATAAGATVIGFRAGETGTPQGEADALAATPDELRDLVLDYFD